MDLGKKIELLRKQKGMSQETLAFKVNVSRQSVFKWECGESTPSVDKLKELASLFEVSLDDLLMDDHDILEHKSAKTKQVTYREVFVSSTSLKFDRDVAMQDGYVTGDKQHYSDLEESCRKANEENLKALTYKKTIGFCHDSKSCVLIDTTNNTFSIYSELAEQFVCPFENLISITLTDAGSRTVINHQNVSGAAIGLNGGAGVMFGSNNSLGKGESAIYYIEFMYHKKDGDIATYKFQVTAYRIHLLYTSDFRGDSGSGAYNFYVDALCNEIKNNLIAIKNTIETYVKETSCDKSLREINLEEKRKAVEYAQKLRAPVLQAFRSAEKKSDRNATAIIVIFKYVLPILLLIGAIILFVVLIKKYI